MSSTRGDEGLMMEAINIVIQATLALATVLLVLVTFLLWKSSLVMENTTKKLAAIAERLAEIAESNRQLEYQPRLIISDVWKDLESSTFRICVKNVGRGIAESVAVQVGKSDWHAYDRVFARRVNEGGRILEAGQEAEWSISVEKAELSDGKLWVGVLYEGAILPPGAANFGTWSSVSTYSDSFAVG